MRVNLNIIIFILIILIFYLGFYQVFPVYKKALDLVGEVNRKNVEAKIIEETKKSLEALQNDPVFQELLANKDKLTSYIPDNPAIENIVYDLVTIYDGLGLVNFPGLSYRLKESELKTAVKIPNKLSEVNFEFRDNMNYPVLLSLTKLIESNIRLIKLDELRIRKDERKGILNVEFKASGFYLP